MKKLLVVAALAALSGCQALPVLQSEEAKMDPETARMIVEQAQKVDRFATYGEPNKSGLVDPAPQVVDPVSQALDQIADQLIKGLEQNNVRRLPMAILPFKSLQNSVNDPLFGERLSESLVFPVQQRGYNLIDYRAVSLATTEKQPVSRGNAPALRQRYELYFLVTGTYARYPDGIVINARVLDTTSRQVLASGQTHIPDSRLEGILGYDPVEVKRQGYIIENNSVPVGVVQ